MLGARFRPPVPRAQEKVPRGNGSVFLVLKDLEASPPEPPGLQMQLEKDTWLQSQRKYLDTTAVLPPSWALGLRSLP